MRRKNSEIKARCHDLNLIREILVRESADFRGTDSQIDTYFATQTGFLKFREATLPFEKGLISYKRSNTKRPKISTIAVYPHDDHALKDVLMASLPVIAVIKKTRELYTIDNVKFHLDTVAKLGTFVEIEAQDTHGLIDARTLTKQCTYYMKLFGITEKDLVSDSYKDLLKK